MAELGRPIFCCLRSLVRDVLLPLESLSCAVARIVVDPAEARILLELAGPLSLIDRVLQGLLLAILLGESSLNFVNAQALLLAGDSDRIDGIRRMIKNFNVWRNYCSLHVVHGRPTGHRVKTDPAQQRILP